jgi:hypothetical protein
MPESSSGDAVPDPAIRRVDLTSVAFQPEGVNAETVHFRGGLAEVPTGRGMPITYSISDGPIYADVDSDADEDATIQISDNGGGNGANSAWWIWLWDGGNARQVQNPFGEHGRCGGPVSLVVPAPDGFTVNDRMWAPDAPCAAESSTPESYSVAVRSGFVVKVRPELAATEQCDPRRFDETAVPRVGTVLRAARDERAPAAAVVADGHRVQRSEAARLYTDPGQPWVFVLHDDGRRRICAWVATAALAPPR